MNLTLNQSRVAFIVFATILAFALALMPDLAFAKDYAASARQDITDTFGPGSTAWFTVLLLEVLASAFVYIKTKNLAVFGGIVALMLFINVATGMF